MCLIEVRGLTKVYGQGDAQVSALRGVDLKIEQGEMVAIVGPSGSGKSTLLSLLGGVDLPTSGSVLLEGRDLSAMSDFERTIVRRRRIGFVFQAFNLIPTLTAVDNVALPLELDGVSSSDAARRAREKLDLVGMSHRSDHLPSQLSGGEQQRVAIARALVIDPAVVLADEPTGNLDTANSQRIAAILRQLVDEHGQTIIIVTHDTDLARQMQRVIRLRDGRVVADGPEGAPQIPFAGATEPSAS